MARSRTLKPEFWTDDVIVELSFAARLFYQGYWNFALCDYGHSDATAKSLKMKIFPADDVDADELIEELVKWGRLIRKSTPDGRPYLHAATLSKHTKMDSRWNTRCPYCVIEGLGKPVSAPPSTDEPTETPASSDEPTETQPSKGKERKGKERKDQPPSEVGKPRSRATRIPDDFAVTAEMVNWARTKAPDVDGRRETEKFINYWRAKSGSGATKLDWPATWRNWMLTAQSDAERDGARASPRKSANEESVNGWLSMPMPGQTPSPATKALPGSEAPG